MINKKVIVGILALLVFLSPVLATPSVLADDGGSSSPGAGANGGPDATGHERRGSTISVNVYGKGLVCWYGPDVDNDCTSKHAVVSVPYGSAVTFTATGVDGSQFSSWNVDGQSNQGSANSYVLTSDYGTEASLTAVFS